MAINIEKQEKLTMDELCDRLDNDFDDVDMQIKECATKGCVAIVYFYENKLSKEKQKNILKEQD